MTKAHWAQSHDPMQRLRRRSSVRHLIYLIRLTLWWEPSLNFWGHHMRGRRRSDPKKGIPERSGPDPREEERPAGAANVYRRTFSANQTLDYHRSGIWDFLNILCVL